MSDIPLKDAGQNFQAFFFLNVAASFLTLKFG